MARLTAYAGNGLRSFTPNGRGACPQDRLFAQLPQAPMGSKSEENRRRASQGSASGDFPNGSGVRR